MYLTNDYLTVWELAHRLANKRPSAFTSMVIPLEVKDNLRLLINEILHWHLESTLIMDTREPDADDEPQYYIRYHLHEIEDCIAGNSYKRSLMKFVHIEKMDFLDWCIKSNYSIPDFWFTEQIIEDVKRRVESGSFVAEEKPVKQTANQIIKRKCQELARQIWKESPDINITGMSENEKIIEICTRNNKPYTQKTIRGWVQEIAPSHIKGNSGRPKKTT